jgi:hypothetical protein
LEVLRQDSSVAFGLGRLDGSGAVPARAVLRVLGWVPGSPIGYRVEEGLVVVEVGRGHGGPVPLKGNLVVPAVVRHRCRMRGGEQVLVAGLPEQNLLVIYPREKLDEMVAGYHDALRRRAASPT